VGSYEADLTPQGSGERKERTGLPASHAGRIKGRRKALTPLQEKEKKTRVVHRSDFIEDDLKEKSILSRPKGDRTTLHYLVRDRKKERKKRKGEAAVDLLKWNIQPRFRRGES